MIRYDTQHPEAAVADPPAATLEPGSDPGERSIRREIAADRARERWLWLKALVALSLVAGLIVVRQVFFA